MNANEFLLSIKEDEQTRKDFLHLVLSAINDSAVLNRHQQSFVMTRLDDIGAALCNRSQQAQDLATYINGCK